jgi:hypothetical protein
MRSYCGGVLDRPIPFLIELKPDDGVYGSPNLYCRWTTRVTDTVDTVTLNLTNYGSSNQFILEAYYINRLPTVRSLSNGPFQIPADGLEEVILHFRMSRSFNLLPFSIDVSASDQGSANFVGLFIALGVIILICIVCSIFFYKCSKVIIENNRRLQERRTLELAAMNNNMLEVNRQEEVKRMNKAILENLFENDLKPIPYTSEVNEFNVPNCTICIEDFTDTSEVIILSCKHLFHSFCLRDWLDKILLIPKCPNCNDLVIPYQKEDRDEHFNSSRAINNAMNATQAGNNNILILNNNLPQQPVSSNDVNRVSQEINPANLRRMNTNWSGPNNVNINASNVLGSQFATETEVRILASTERQELNVEDYHMGRNNYLQRLEHQ